MKEKRLTPSEGSQGRDRINRKLLLFILNQTCGWPSAGAQTWKTQGTPGMLHRSQLVHPFQHVLYCTVICTNIHWQGMKTDVHHACVGNSGTNTALYPGPDIISAGLLIHRASLCGSLWFPCLRSVTEVCIVVAMLMCMQFNIHCSRCECTWTSSRIPAPVATLRPQCCVQQS